MNVTELPFNKLIGLKLSDNPDYLMMLDDKTAYHNHLGTVHASAEFALAEASGGLYLSREFGKINGIVPVVRKAEVKYKQPGKGRIYSDARILNSSKEEIQRALVERSRLAITIEVSLFDETGLLIMQCVFEWIIMKGA